MGVVELKNAETELESGPVITVQAGVPVSEKMDREFGSLKVDHILSPSLFSETFVMFDGETRAPLMYADVNWKEVMKQGCKNCSTCKHGFDGLRIPVFEGSVENTKGALSPSGPAVATMVLEWPCCDQPAVCCCYLPTFKAQVVSGTSGPPIANFLSEGGMKFCPCCIDDAPIVVTDGEGAQIMQLAGAQIPCCNCCKDDSYPRLANDGSLMQRYVIDQCGSGPGEPVGFRRMPQCFCPCSGPPVTLQTYEISNNCKAKPEVWVALALFEATAYPYHKSGGGGGDGGGGGGGG
jgi:hypothetical protein